MIDTFKLDVFYFIFIRSVTVLVAKALSGNSLYRLESQVEDNDSEYILNEQESRWDHFRYLCGMRLI